MATSLNNLGELRWVAGDHAGARPLYERALTIWEQALGRTHPHVATSLNNLAVLREAAGDHSGARPLYERALGIARTTGHPELYWLTAFHLGRLRQREARPADALDLYHEAVAALNR